MWHYFLQFATITLEAIGVIIIFFGILYGIFHAIREVFWHKNTINIYTTIRKEIAYAILLGLEILIAVDIIKSIDTNLDIQGVLSLGLVVVIRTILSISLEWEIEGKLPWKKSEKNLEK